MKKSGLIAKLTSCISAGILSLSLTGCGPIPTPISISGGDGRYISYSSTESGDVYLLKKPIKDIETKSTINLSLVTYDVQTNSIVNNLEIDKVPIGLSNTKNHVAYSFIDDKKNSHIAFINNGRKKVIKNACYPVMSHYDGCLAYTKNTKTGNDSTNFIYLDYFKTGLLHKTSIEGAPLAFSPDTSYLSFTSIDSKDKKMYLGTLHIPSGITDKLIKITNSSKNLDNALPYFPQWIDNEKILFQNLPRDGAKTTEIYVVEKDGDILRITDNAIEELGPMISKKGEIFYVGLDPDNQVFTESPVYISKTDNGFWKEFKTKFTAQWTRVSGDKLIFAANKGEVFSVPLEDIVNGNKSNIKNISSSVKTKKEINSFFKKLFN